MAILSQDQTAQDEAQEIAFWRSLPIWRKIQIIGDLYESMETVALADLRRHHPADTPEQLYARLIARRMLLEQANDAS